MLLVCMQCRVGEACACNDSLGDPGNSHDGGRNLAQVSYSRAVGGCVSVCVCACVYACVCVSLCMRGKDGAPTHRHPAFPRTLGGQRAGVRGWFGEPDMHWRVFWVLVIYEGPTSGQPSALEVRLRERGRGGWKGEGC